MLDFYVSGIHVRGGDGVWEVKGKVSYREKKYTTNVFDFKVLGSGISKDESVNVLEEWDYDGSFYYLAEKFVFLTGKQFYLLVKEFLYNGGEESLVPVNNVVKDIGGCKARVVFINIPRIDSRAVLYKISDDGIRVVSVIEYLPEVLEYFVFEDSGCMSVDSSFVVNGVVVDGVISSIPYLYIKWGDFSNLSDSDVSIDRFWKYLLQNWNK